MNKNVGLAVLQRDVEKYAKQVSKGHSFVVTKRSRPLFKIVAVDEEVDEDNDGKWETVIDFTKLTKDGKGIPASELVRRLEAMK